MHLSTFSLLGFFLPFVAIYGAYGAFNALRRVTPDISIPTVAAFNTVLASTVFPWLIVDDFGPLGASDTLFYAMLVGVLIAAASADIVLFAGAVRRIRKSRRLRH